MITKDFGEAEWTKFYGEVYDIVVEHGGAVPRHKSDFVRHAIENHHPWTEWRFCGHLGFGGKLWRYDGRIYITCYPEDRNPDRMKLIEKVNKLIAAIMPPEGVHGSPAQHRDHLRYREDLSKGGSSV
jgi:hypothetical protein